VDIIVAAFQPQVRAALQSQLNEGGLGAAVEIDSPATLAHALAELTEPVVVAGVHWPETAPFLRRATGHEVPVALLLEEQRLDARHAAFRAGAAALLPWPLASAPLASALEAVGHGFRLLARRSAPAARPVPTAGLRSLSPRERELIELVAAGLSNKGIARHLGLSVNTVKYHLASAFTKLEARTRAEAVSAAARRGELTL
jgi:DNA-binding NarL/FixJ family response regulator